MSWDQFFQTFADALAERVAKRLEPIPCRSNLNATAETVNRDQILNRKQAAAYLKLAPMTLAIMASQKRGPSYFRIGRSVRYRMSDLDQFLEDNRGLVGCKGRPPAKPVIVNTNGSVHVPRNQRTPIQLSRRRTGVGGGSAEEPVGKRRPVREARAEAGRSKKEVLG